MFQKAKLLLFVSQIFKIFKNPRSEMAAQCNPDAASFGESQSVLSSKLYLILTMIPVHHYFLLKFPEHNVTLRSFMADLSGTRENFLYQEICQKRVFKVWWRYLLSFMNYRKITGGRSFASSPYPMGCGLQVAVLSIFGKLFQKT